MSSQWPRGKTLRDQTVSLYGVSQQQNVLKSKPKANMNPGSKQYGKGHQLWSPSYIPHFQQPVRHQLNARQSPMWKGESGQLPRNKPVCNSRDRQGAGLTASTGMVKQYPLSLWTWHITLGCDFRRGIYHTRILSNIYGTFYHCRHHTQKRQLQHILLLLLHRCAIIVVTNLKIYSTNLFHVSWELCNWTQTFISSW